MDIKMAKIVSVYYLLILFCFVIVRPIVSCPTKCRCTGTATICMYKDITTAELQAMAPYIPRNTTKLYLNGNKITSFPTNYFKDLEQLQYLSLSFNRIAKLPENLFRYFPLLQTLYLASNEIKSISSIELVSLSRIKVLNLDSNLIETIPDFTFSKMVDLTELLLAQNSLSVITENTFDGLTSLVKLQLNNNGLKMLHENSFKDAPKLKEISLASNNLHTLPNEIFSGLQSLRTLHLYNNKLKELGETVFKGLHLDEIFLNSNLLKTIPVRLFDHTKIDGRVYFHDNKLTCDCKLLMGTSLYFGELIDAGKLVLGKCYSPRRFKRRQVKNVTSAELNCTVCDLDPCKDGYACVINSTSKNHTCEPPVAPFMDRPDKGEEISSGEKPNYVTYAVIAICILCVFGLALGAYFIISNRRKRKAFEVSTVEAESYVYEKVNLEKDPELTGLTSKTSFKIIDLPPIIKPEFV